MKNKAVSGIMLTMLLICILTLAFCVQSAHSEPTTWAVNDKDIGTSLVLSVSRTLEEEWIGSIGTSIESLVVGDADNDGKNELVICGNDGTVNVYSFDGVNYIREWFTDIGIIARGTAIGDSDGDGTNEISAGSQLLEIPDKGFVYVFGFNGSTYVDEWSIEVLSEAGVHDVVFGDTDGDGTNEIVTGEHGVVRVFSYADYTYIEDWNYSSGTNFWVTVGDVDGDEVDEIVMAINGGYLRVFSYSSAEGRYVLDWGTSGLGRWPWEVVTGDSDGDQIDEIAVGDDEGVVRIYDFDGSTYLQTYQIDIGSDAYGLAVGDINADGLSEVVAGGGLYVEGKYGGSLYILIYNGTSYTEHWNTTFRWHPVQSATVGDIDNDGMNEILVGVGYVLHVLGIPKPPSPVEATQELIETIETWNLTKGTENSLKAKLKVAIHLLDMGKEDEAIRKLTAFINRVEMLREKTLTPEQADYLIAEAQRIIDLIKG